MLCLIREVNQFCLRLKCKCRQLMLLVWPLFRPSASQAGVDFVLLALCNNGPAALSLPSVLSVCVSVSLLLLSAARRLCCLSCLLAVLLLLLLLLMLRVKLQINCYRKIVITDATPGSDAMRASLLSAADRKFNKEHVWL